MIDNISYKLGHAFNHLYFSITNNKKSSIIVYLCTSKYSIIFDVFFIVYIFQYLTNICKQNQHKKKNRGDLFDIQTEPSWSGLLHQFVQVPLASCFDASLSQPAASSGIRSVVYAYSIVVAICVLYSNQSQLVVCLF